MDYRLRGGGGDVGGLARFSDDARHPQQKMVSLVVMIGQIDYLSSFIGFLRVSIGVGLM